MTRTRKLNGNSRSERHDGTIVIHHLKALLLAIACSSLIACGTRTPEVISTITPIPEEVPARTPTTPVETPMPPIVSPTLPVPDFGPIPDPILDLSKSEITQTQSNSRTPGTWSKFGRLLNPRNGHRIISLHDGRLFFIVYGFMETKWDGKANVPVKRNSGSGELFDPVTSRSTPFKNLDYNSSFELKDGRILLFHPERTSVFDPKDNSFTHLRIAPFALLNENAYLREIGSDLIYHDHANGKQFRYDFQAGRLLSSPYPVTTAIAKNIPVPREWRLTINNTYFEDDGGTIWEIRPDFIPKTTYSEEEVVAGDWFYLKKLDQNLETVSQLRIKLPLDIRSAGFFSKDILIVNRYLENTSGASSDCSRVYIDLKQAKLNTFHDGCGRYSGFHGAIQTGPNTVLYFNPTIFPGDVGPYMRLFTVDGSKKELQLQPINAQHVSAVFKLKNGKFMFMGGNRCAGGFSNRCYVGSDGPRDWVEIYDPLSHAFDLAGDPNQIRSQTNLVQLSDGSILMTGGLREIRKPGLYNPQESTFEPVDSIEIYTPDN
jgi:hypothetical protein